MKALKYMLYILLVLAFVGWFALRFLVSFGYSQSKGEQFFSEAGVEAQFIQLEVEGRELFYVEVAEQQQPTVIFVHGSPGSWDAYKDYMLDSLMRANTRMISIDRLGYGGSEKGQPEASMQAQAAVLKPLLEESQAHGPVILVGHSLGGPVIARAAMDFPELVDGLVFVAASVDPEMEKLRAIQKPFAHPALRWLLPPDIDVSNREIIPLKTELQSMMPLWDSIRAQSIIIQGNKDRLVPKENADFMMDKLDSHITEEIRLAKGNHFILWTKREMIQQKILELIERCQQ